MDKVRHYLEIALKKWNIELLGIIPYDEVLVYPSMRHIVKAVKGKVLNGREYLSNVVADTIAGINMEFAQVMIRQNFFLLSATADWMKLYRTLKIFVKSAICLFIWLGY